jgi:hypothetical protein
MTAATPRDGEYRALTQLSRALGAIPLQAAGADAYVRPRQARPQQACDSVARLLLRHAQISA